MTRARRCARLATGLALLLAAVPCAGAARASGATDAGDAGRTGDAGHTGDARRGTIRSYTIPAPALHDDSRSARVYLPPSYDHAGSETRRYPVVYLLHGWPGGDGNWPGSGRAGQTLDSLSARGAIPEIIAVMPNGNGIGLLGRSLYLNSYDGRSRMEDFIAHDLVEWTDRSFRTLADSTHRAIIGLSEGASAALNICFRHPGVFNACGGHSGQYVLQRDVGMGPVWGPEPGAARIRRENSPTLYVERLVPQLGRQVIYFDCGTGDGELADNRALDRRLAGLGVPHTFREFPGSHGWGYWRTHLRDSLIACTARMR
ncbi:MAG: hypothetical protein HZC42_04355 [Candidatus Eisenbacteria bacterium]|nr:hypothetical protein [Candidatus Eisenbacteria bacterium]